MNRHEAEQAIAHDLNTIDMALIFAKGRARTKFIQHRKACMAQIKGWNVDDGVDGLTDGELLMELSA